MSQPNAETVTDPLSLDEVDGEGDEASETPGAAAEETELEDDDDDDDEHDAQEQASFEAIQKERAEEERARRASAARTASRAPARESAPPAPARPVMLARIKHFNPKKGQTMRTHAFNHGSERAKFVEGAGWYEVDLALAARLKEIRCSDMDPDSNLAFDVCTPAEARKQDAREEQEREQETRSPAKRPRSATA